MPTGAAYPRRRTWAVARRKRGREWSETQMPKARLSKSMSYRTLSKPFRFIRHKELSVIQNVCGAGPTPAPTLGGMNFTLADVPAYTEFTALFDQYRIAWVRVEFFPCFDSSQAALFGAQAAQYFPFYTAVDYDDSSAPASVDAICQYSNCQRHQLGKKFTVFIRPRCLSMIYRSAVATDYALAPYGQWLDCGNASTPHYGLHYAIQEMAQLAGTINLWIPHVVYCIECKNLR